MSFLDTLAELPSIVRYLVVFLVILHAIAFIVYLVLLARSSPQKDIIQEGIKKLQEAELKAKKGSKIE